MHACPTIDETTSSILHQVKSQLKEKLDELPTQEELQKKADNFIAQLPNYKVRT